MRWNDSTVGNITRRAFLQKLGLLGVGIGLPLMAQHWRLAAQTPRSVYDKAISKQITQLINDFAKQESAVGLAVGVVYPDASKSALPMQQTYFWGETQQGNDQKPDEKTIFGIGSVGKVFTTTLLADIVFNQKLLALDDLVQPYYDKFAPGLVKLPAYQGEGIRFVHLATHTAGLPDQPNAIKSDECGTPMAAVYDFLNHFKLPQAPGDQAVYSDLGFDLLSDILNKISGSASRDRSLTDMLTRAQLTMPDTGAITLAMQKNPRYAAGYDTNAKGNPTVADLITCDSGSDHVGQFASTLSDMLLWAQFNLGLTASPFTALLSELQKARHQMGGPDTR